MRKIILICLAFLSVGIQAEDIIITNDAKKITAKIEEVTPTEIKYKKTNYLNGPSFVMPTSDILCVIFENDEVMIIDQPKKEVAAQKSEKQNSLSKIDVTMEELMSFDERPRKMVAKSGNYSMLYDKKALVYFDVNLEQSYIAKFGYSEVGIENWAFAIDEYNRQHPDFHSLDFSEAYKLFNENPLNPKKCYLVKPGDDSVDKSQYNAFYKMEFQLRFLDVGNGTVSSMSINTGDAGGAVIYGELVITDLATDKEVGRILVDRIKGKGSPYANVRLQNAVSEMLVPELFHIKKK